MGSADEAERRALRRALAAVRDGVARGVDICPGDDEHLPHPHDRPPLCSCCGAEMVHPMMAFNGLVDWSPGLREMFGLGDRNGA